MAVWRHTAEALTPPTAPLKDCRFWACCRGRSPIIHPLFSSAAISTAAAPASSIAMATQIVLLQNAISYSLEYQNKVGWARIIVNIATREESTKRRKQKKPKYNNTEGEKE